MEQKSIQNLLKQAVCKKLHQKFAIPIYMEEIPQKAKLPCFCVTVQETKKQPLLGRRFWVDNHICIAYHADGEKQKAIADVAEQLYDAVWFVEYEQKFQGRNMIHKQTTYGLLFEVWYGYGLAWQEQDVLMGALHQKGGTNVAEKSDIYKNTVFGE